MFSKKKGAEQPLGAGAAPEDAPENATPSPKRGKSLKAKLAIGGAVFAVIVVAAGAGYAVLHDAPAFCNAICHSPMDAYVEDYNEGDDLARVHKEANVTCIDCHEPTLSQQVSEAAAWVTGQFPAELDMMTDYDNDQCLKCHISEEFQAVQTDYLAMNPHADSHQVLQCTDCHKSHRDQVDFCAQCHSNKGMRMITWPMEGHEAVEEEEAA